jgi:hypothetical protein
MNNGINLINTNFRFSLFPKLYLTAPTLEIDINGLIEIIKYGYLITEIEDLRNTKSIEEYKEIKKELPAVTISGIFTSRNSEGIIKHSGLIQIDIDNVPDYNILFEQLCNDAYTYLCFRSPGGKGIKIIVKIFQSINTHLFQFNSLENYYKQKYGVEIDPMCNDIPRLMLLSYDPNIFCNPYSKLYTDQLDLTDVHTIKTKQIIKSKNQTDGKFTGNNDIVLKIIEKIEVNKIDITGNYKDWLKIGFALSAEFGENGRAYFHKISRFYPYYNSNDADKQYSECLKNNNRKTSLGTLIFIANKMLQ